MASPLHIWGTVIISCAIVTILWLVFQPVIFTMRDAALPFCTTPESLTVVESLMFLWYIIPVGWFVGMIFWAFHASQKQDWETVGYYPS